MSKNTIDFVNGLTFYTEQENSKFFKELKKLLKRLNVQFEDKCCSSNNSSNSKCFTNSLLGFECSDGIITITIINNNAKPCIIAKGGINNVISTIEVKHNGISLFTTALDTPANNGSFEYDNGGQFKFVVADWGSTGNIELQYNLVYNDSSTENVTITGSYDANTLCM